MPPLVELEGAGKSYGAGLFRHGGVTALHPLSLTLSAEQPAIIAVVGESGSGKTTLGNMLLGLLSPDRGALRYRGQEITRMDRRARRGFRREVQAITQDPFAAYNPFYVVDHALDGADPQIRPGQATGRRCRELAAGACAAVGLNPRDTLGRYPHQLSGGQRQRLMVARALLLRPRLLVADEPVSMVDASLRATILASVVKLNREHGISIVYITHDITTAYQVADEVLVLYRGHVVERGSAVSVIGEPRHPYTKLLVNSIPWPDLDRRWEGLPAASATAPGAAGAAACPFLSRCPEAMPVCRDVAPPMTRYGADGEAACHAVAARA